MKPPIVCNDNFRRDMAGDIGFFATLEQALVGLEPDDASDTSIHVFDSEGRLLRLVDRGCRVSIEDDESLPQQADTLQKILVEWFVIMGYSKEWCDAASLEELVAEGVRAFAR